MFTDYYQLTMMYGYYKSGKMDQEVVFDLFFRRNPFKNGYTIAAGLESVIEYIENLSFTDEDIRYLRSLNTFDEAFLDELKNFRFTGDLYAVPEGTVVFPNEPLIRVKARLFEAQLIETAMLSLIGFQTLIATKANRVARAAKGKAVMEFGARRAQGPHSAVIGARAAIIGGFGATSNLKAAEDFGLTVAGTHAHSWVMSFEKELDAFRTYAEMFPDNLILLVDTYDTLKSGVPHAITVFNEIHERHGKPKKFGIRLDSGDLAYLSKEARKLLDEAGYPDAIIVASSDLDEYTIRDLEEQGARIDSYGIGTKLITAYDQPALGCVYKLAANKIGDEWVPRIKKSDNVQKITNPGLKKIYRYIKKDTEKATVDLIMLDEEEEPSQPFTAFHPIHTWKKKKITNAYAIELLKPIFINGEFVYQQPSLTEIVENTKWHLSKFSEEYLRFLNPHIYHVDLSEKLWGTKMELLKSMDSVE